MKILHIIDSLKVGGAQTLLVTYAQQARSSGMNTSGMNTSIVSLQQKQENSLTAALGSMGAEITYMPKAPLRNASRFLRLLKLIRKENFDLLHTHLAHANVLGILCAISLRIPVIVSMHNILSGRKRSRSTEKLERFLLRFATRIIAVGENVAADYRPLFPKTIVTLPNAVNEIPRLAEDERIVLRQTLTGDAHAPILIAVGRLTEQKGFSDLLRAFEIIHAKNPSAILIIAGDGHLRAKLQDDTEARGLQSHVRWLGMRNDVPNLLAVSDVYLSAAHWEGLSIALLEAMSAGLPAVVTQVGDAPNVIVPGTGVLVPPRAPDQFATAVEALLQNPPEMRRMGSAARERIHAEYGSQAWFAKLMEIYEGAITQTTKRP
jgi:glycosyltransferase involved in cell wall biosynthesis